MYSSLLDHIWKKRKKEDQKNKTLQYKRKRKLMTIMTKYKNNMLLATQKKKKNCNIILRTIINFGSFKRKSLPKTKCASRGQKKYNFEIRASI